MDIKLNQATGDLDVTDFIAPRMFTDGEEVSAIAQRVLIRLRTFLGEWFLDETKGVPWLQSILASKNRSLALALLRNVVQQTPGIVTIIDFDGELDSDRLFSITRFRATTTAGPLDLSGVPVQTAATRGSPWTPAALGASLAFWWDFPDATSLSAPVDSILSVDDKSGNGRTLTPRKPGTPSLASIDVPNDAPVYSSGQARYVNSSTSRNLGWTGVTGLLVNEIMLAARFANGATFNSAGNGAALFGASEGDPSTGIVSGNVLAGQDGQAYFTNINDGNPNTIRINGGADFDVSTLTPVLPTLNNLGIVGCRPTTQMSFPKGVVVGAGPNAFLNAWRGLVGVTVGIVGSITEKQRKRLEGYIAHAHGIKSVLPSSHPYRFNPPMIDD